MNWEIDNKGQAPVLTVTHKDGSKTTHTGGKAVLAFYVLGFVATVALVFGFFVLILGFMLMVLLLPIALVLHPIFRLFGREGVYTTTPEGTISIQLGASSFRKVEK